MAEKLEFYDILGILVPGVLLIYLFVICFPGAGAAIHPRMSDALNAIAFTATAIFLGQIVQAIASLLEGVLYWTWGGRPSERALRSGLGNRYLPEETAKRIRTKLKKAVGEHCTDRDLFLYAMQRAENAGSQRVTKFNALFAYHRALVVFCLVALAFVLSSAGLGIVAALPRWEAGSVVFGALALLILIWHRTRQRAFYYVREVLLTAERVIDTPPGAPKSP
jgi:hypothetical protein